MKTVEMKKGKLDVLDVVVETDAFGEFLDSKGDNEYQKAGFSLHGPRQLQRNVRRLTEIGYDMADAARNIGGCWVIARWRGFGGQHGIDLRCFATRADARTAWKKCTPATGRW
ncbi:MAG TPA: hypothetical protein VGF90_05580 [Verrucomicrobiae bacterium]